MIRQITPSGQIQFTGKNFEQVIKKIPETSGTFLAIGNKKDQQPVQIVSSELKAH